MAQALITPESVDSIFNNLSKCLPEWVPALPSIRKGMLVTIVIVVISLIVALISKDQLKDKKDLFSQSFWILIILAGIYGGAQIGDYVKDKDYTIRCIKTNKQHYSNIHWLKLYMQAFKLQ